MGEVGIARKVGARVDELSTRRGEDERIRPAGKRGGVAPGVGDEDVRAAVSIEVAEDGPAGKDGSGDGAIEQGLCSVAEVALAVTDEDRYLRGLRILEVDAGHDHIDVSVSVEIGRPHLLEVRRRHRERCHLHGRQEGGCLYRRITARKHENRQYQEPHAPRITNDTKAVKRLSRGMD
jgi:hypothetical protein